MNCSAWRPRFQLGTVLVGLGASLAAPCLAAAIAASDDERSAADPPPADAPAATTGHQTIDLLLQMNVAAEPAARPPPDPKAARRGTLGDNADTAALMASAPAAAAAEKTEWGTSEPLKQALQSLGVQSWRGGTAADPAREDRRRLIEQDRASRGVLDPGGAPQRRSSLLDLPVVRYIRENRMLVLAGATAVLALVWGAATFSFHRRRR